MNLKERKKLINYLKNKVKQYRELNIKDHDDNVFMCIDMSKIKPGICIMNNNGHLLYAGSLPGDRKEKSLEILLWVEDLIEEYNPSKVIFEEVFTKFKKVSLILSRYQGLIFSLFVRENIPCYSISNLVVKREFGTNKKEVLFETIKKMYDVDINFEEFNDETDAIAIGIKYLLDRKSIKKFV